MAIHGDPGDSEPCLVYSRASLAKADDVQLAGLVTLTPGVSSTEPVAAAGLHVRPVPGERLRADVFIEARGPRQFSRD